MKKFVLLNLIVLFAVAITFAGNSKAEMFSYEKEQVQSEFAEMNQLENFVNTHEGATLNEIKSFRDAPDFAGINSPSPENMLFDINDMEWGSFAWGFLCCPVGFFVVALNDRRSQHEKTSFWIGAITSAVLSSISTVTVVPASYY
ncbi:MAG: hypothetical protein ACOCPM_01135 [Bacteroidales bacterium]